MQTNLKLNTSSTGLTDIFTAKINVVNQVPFRRYEETAIVIKTIKGVN